MNDKKNNEIECPVCNTYNQPLAQRCSKCHSYLQNRIVNIDFYETLWLIIEQPNSALKKIILAEHKNYSFILFLVVGVYSVILLSKFLRYGENYENMWYVMSAVFSKGLIYGGIYAITLPLLHRVIARLFGAKRTRFKNIYSLIAYSSIPVLFILVFIFPLNLLSFGLHYFTSNPHPVVINAPLYYILFGIEILLLIWTAVLLTMGSHIAYQTSFIRSFFINFFTFFTASGIVYYISTFLIH